MVWGANFAVRRSAVDRIGEFDESFDRGHGDEEEWLLRLRAAGGLYVPLGSNDPPRGMVAEGVEELGTGFVSTDVLGPEEFRAKLDWALEQVRETDARMRGGELGCDPDQCAWNGGCSYPSICRCEG